MYFLTTYREEGLVGKVGKRSFINTPYGSFLTTYGEEVLVGKLIIFRLLTPLP